MNLNDVCAEIAEQARLSEMREQTEKFVKGIFPDVSIVLSLPTHCLYADASTNDDWTAIAVVNVEDVDDERNITAEGGSQGEALLNLAALVKEMNI